MRNQGPCPPISYPALDSEANRCIPPPQRDERRDRQVNKEKGGQEKKKFNPKGHFFVQVAFTKALWKNRPSYLKQAVKFLASSSFCTVKEE